MKNPNLQSLFKKWIVKRPNGMCQILFSLTELDNFCKEINKFYKRELPAPTLFEIFRPEFNDLLKRELKSQRQEILQKITEVDHKYIGEDFRRGCNYVKSEAIKIIRRYYSNQ